MSLSLKLTLTHVLLQFLNVAGAAVNAWFFVLNLSLESYWLAAVSGSALAVIVGCFIMNERRMARERREVREWKAQCEAMLRSYPFLPVMTGLPLRCPELELEYCRQQGICPDCMKRTLDPKQMLCTDATCGSRFTISPTGEWGRA